MILTGVRLVPSMETLQKDAAKDVDIELPWSEFKELLDGLEDKFGQEHDICVYSVLFPCFHSTCGYICGHFCLKHNSQLVALHARFLAVDMLSVSSSSMHMDA